MVGISASAQAYLNVDLQDRDSYFTKGGINIGVSVIEKLDNIGENWRTELGIGFFKNDAATINQSDLAPNALVGLGYAIKDDVLTYVLKANYRGYLINDTVKGYFEPGLEVQFHEQFAVTFGHAFEIHKYGYNIPTGRLGLKFKF